MAIDFLIFILLLLSFAINLLALGAFWATPGLRTMANRFVMNLLVMNLFGCLVLTPTLFLTTSTVITEDITNIKITRNDTPEVLRGDWNNTEMMRETFFNCNNTGCEEIIVANDPSAGTLLITSVDVRNVTAEGDIFGGSNERKVRWWPLDLAAALGALSVLLVVGDTWCAVTDPLRYHDRVSSIRSWLLIAMTWFLSILCGVLSALRDNVFIEKINGGDFEFTTKEADSYGRAFELYEGTHFQSGSSDVNGLYNTIFSSTYFVLVILLPFLLVCSMYWRIFTEAKENGHRIRQNGSSPLLQSALNLSGGMPSQKAGSGPQILETGGISLKIDRRRMSERELTKTLASIVPGQKANPNELEIMEADQNHNVILTLTAANDEIKRNMSAKQLSLIDEEIGQPNSASKNIRHVHSTPNMQKSENGNMSMNTGIDHSYATTLQLPPIQASHVASYMTSIRHRLSNASSLFKYREESRAARISTLVVIMFAISYMPYGVLIILQSAFRNYFDGSTQILFLMILIGNLSSPFIFAYRNKRLQRGMKKMLGIGARTRKSKLNEENAVFRRINKSTNVKRISSKGSSASSTSSNKILLTTKRSFLVGVEKRQFSDNKCNFQSNVVAERPLGIPEGTTGLKSICEKSKTLYCGANICSTSDSDEIDV